MRWSVDLQAADDMSLKAAEGGVRAAQGKAEQVLKEDILNRQGSGRTYRRGGREHQSSAAGEPPAPDLGNLKAQTNADPNLSRDGSDIVGTITADAEYAQALEVGTERIAPRPYFGLLITDHAEALQTAFDDGAKS